MAREVLGRLREHVGTRCRRDPLSDALLVGEALSCRLALLDGVRRRAPGELGMRQGVLHEVLELLDALPLQRLELVGGQREQVEGTGLAGRAEVHGQLQDRLLRQRVRPARRRPQQSCVGHEPRDRLLAGSAEVEPQRDATGDGHRVLAVGRVQQHRGEEQPLGMLECLPFLQLMQVIESRPPESARGVELERVGLPASQRPGELGQGAVEDSGEGKEAPRARAAPGEQLEEAGARGAVPHERAFGQGGHPVEQPGTGAVLAAEQCGVEHDAQGLAERRLGG